MMSDCALTPLASLKVEFSTVRRFLKTLEIELPYDPAIPLLGIHTEETRIDLLYNGLVGSPCSPKDSQESSPTPQFKSINSLALSFLHSPTLTSIHDHRKNHSVD